MLETIEAWLYRNAPFVYADGLSSVFHGLVVGFPTLLLGLIWAPAGTAVGLVLVVFYWRREDSDSKKAARKANARERNESLKDSKRDRWFPVFFYLFANLVLYL